MTSSCVSIKDSAIVNEVSDEKLEEIYTLNEDAVRLSNDGRTFETTQMKFFHCVTGKNLYFSGIHRIRSRQIKPVPDSMCGGSGMCMKTPSAYGWLTNGGRLANGWFDPIRLPYLTREDAIFTITINCDERRLTIVINENNQEQDEMDVYSLHAPFPWCLFVELSRAGARISLL